MSESPPPPPPIDSPSPSTKRSKSKIIPLKSSTPKRIPESPKGRQTNFTGFSTRKGSKVPTPGRSRSPMSSKNENSNDGNSFLGSKVKMPFQFPPSSTKKESPGEGRKSPPRSLNSKTAPIHPKGGPMSPQPRVGPRSMFSRRKSNTHSKQPTPSKRSSSAPVSRLLKPKPLISKSSNKGGSDLLASKPTQTTSMSNSNSSSRRTPPSSHKKGDSPSTSSTTVLETVDPLQDPLTLDLDEMLNRKVINDEMKHEEAFDAAPSSESSLSLLMHCQPSMKERDISSNVDEEDETGVLSPHSNQEVSLAPVSPSSISRARSSFEILSLLNNIPTSPEPSREKVTTTIKTRTDKGNRTEPLEELSSEFLEHLSCVVPGVYIGDIEAAVSADMLSAAGITHVVDLSNSFVDENTEVAKTRPTKNVNYEVVATEGSWAAELPMLTSKLVVRVDDVEGAPLAEHFQAINTYTTNAILESSGRVLVHCFRGKSRSATAVVQYLMQVEKMNLKQAMAATRAARPCIDINITFRKALMALERELRPDEEPSVKLRLTSRKPVLSSASRSTSRSARSKSAPIKRMEETKERVAVQPLEQVEEAEVATSTLEVAADVVTETSNT